MNNKNLNDIYNKIQILVEKIDSFYDKLEYLDIMREDADEIHSIKECILENRGDLFDSIENIKKELIYNNCRIDILINSLKNNSLSYDENNLLKNNSYNIEKLILNHL